jgi:hypothetical protein
MQNHIIVGSLILVISAAMPPPASAIDGRVEVGCASDYLTYCSRHDPDGRPVRRCMRANQRKLSRACVDALIAAGEVSANEAARRARR